MEPVRSLRELFASMSHGTADPAAALAEAGHGELPGHLVTEAIVNYADTAPVEVAEHLSPFVVAHSAVPASDGHPYPADDLQDGFSLLTSAPAPVEPEHHDDDPFGVHHDLTGPHTLLDDVSHHDDAHHDLGQDHAGQDAAADDSHDAHHGEGGHTDLWFGHGQAAALAPHGVGDPLTPTDDPVQHDFAAAHDDPWLDVSGETVSDHSAPEGLDLWHENADAGHDAGPGHDAGHAQLPVPEPVDHDLPIDPGHA